MTDIGKLAGIEPGEADQLRATSGGVPGDTPIETIDKLWRRVGTNRWTGIGQVAAAKGLSEARLRELLVAQATHEADVPKRWPAWLRRHVSGLVMMPLLLLAALVPLLTRAYAPPPFGQNAPLSRHVVVSASEGLDAFHLVGSDDVDVRDGPARPRTIASPEAVAGRYTLARLASGAAVTRDRLSAPCPPRAGLSPTTVAPAAGTPAGAPSTTSGTQAPAAETVEDRRILTVPVKPAALASVEPGACASLVLSPRENDGSASRILDNVTVLAVNRQAEASSIVVALALTPAERDELARLLGSADVFVVQPTR